MWAIAAGSPPTASWEQTSATSATSTIWPRPCGPSMRVTSGPDSAVTTWVANPVAATARNVPPRRRQEGTQPPHHHPPPASTRW